MFLIIVRGGAILRFVPKTLAFIHTVHSLVEYFDRLARAELPEPSRIHTLDEPLLQRIGARGTLAPEDSDRLASHVAASAEAGADAVLVTCSTLSPCVEEIRGRFTLPVLKIDEAMFAEAVRRGGKVAVIVTNPSTAGPTREGLLAAARNPSQSPEIVEEIIPSALDALSAGRAEEHDRLIAEAAARMAPEAHVIVLAQASMARSAAAIDLKIRPKVLTSPQTALAAAAAHLMGP
jgi:Asp/Glu/hydantoin racemase